MKVKTTKPATRLSLNSTLREVTSIEIWLYIDVTASAQECDSRQAAQVEVAVRRSRCITPGKSVAGSDRPSHPGTDRRERRLVARES